MFRLAVFVALILTGTCSSLYSHAQTIDFSSGFSSNPSPLIVNGSAALTNGVLRLTSHVHDLTGSAFYSPRVEVSTFTSAFTFQITDPGADGFTFTVQGVSPTVLGGYGGGLGYGNIPNSIALKFDIHQNPESSHPDPSANCTGLYANGTAPLGGFDLNGTGINLRSGNVMRTDLDYNGSLLRVTITDTITFASSTQNYTIDIPFWIGSNTGYVGFTGSTGGLTSIQEIRTWRYVGTTPIALVSGRLILQSASNQAQPVSFDFRPTDGSAMFQRVVTLNADGTYSLADIPRKNYNVRIKGTKWLSKTVIVNATNGNVSNVNATLLTGDVNNDDFADIADLLLLINAYNKVAPNAGYSEAADFDGDGKNDITDLLRVIGNYNKQGDS